MNEELHSTNEELETINDELRDRTGELNGVNDFLESILTSLGVGRRRARPSSSACWSGTEAPRSCGGCARTRPPTQHFLGLDIGLGAGAPGPRAARGDQRRERAARRRELEAVNRRGRGVVRRHDGPAARSPRGDGDGPEVARRDRADGGPPPCAPATTADGSERFAASGRRPAPRALLADPPISSAALAAQGVERLALHSRRVAQHGRAPRGARAAARWVEAAAGASGGPGAAVGERRGGGDRG